MSLSIVLVVVAATRRPRTGRSHYTWNERRVICSLGIDDYEHPVDWARFDRELARAAIENSVLLVHAHIPGRTVSIATLEKLFQLVRRYHLHPFVYDELAPGTPPRGGIALAFDDNSVTEWFSIRGLLRTYDMRATFFVTLLHLMKPAELAMLHDLAADGHSIESHSYDHAEAPIYVARHGEVAYLTDEVVTSLVGLRGEGYAPASFAYPYGDDVPSADPLILQVVDRIRVGMRQCPRR